MNICIFVATNADRNVIDWHRERSFKVENIVTLCKAKRGK